MSHVARLASDRMNCRLDTGEIPFRGSACPTDRVEPSKAAPWETKPFALEGRGRERGGKEGRRDKMSTVSLCLRGGPRILDVWRAIHGSLSHTSYVSVCESEIGGGRTPRHSRKADIAPLWRTGVVAVEQVPRADPAPKLWPCSSHRL